MEQRGNYAAVKDAQIMLRMEDCASGTVRRSSYAAVKDAQIKFRKEECVLSMVHDPREDARLKDVPTPTWCRKPPGFSPTFLPFAFGWV